MRNKAISATDLQNSAEAALRARLPRSWLVTRSRPARAAERGPNFLIKIRAPDGKKATLAGETRTRLDPKDVPLSATRIRRMGAGAPLIVAPFLSPRTRELLEKEDVAYMDQTGNLRIALERPAVFLSATGKQTNPWREGRPLRSLKGAGAGQVVRALCDFRPPFGIRELAERTRLAPGSISRTVSFLDGEALVKKDGKGAVVDVDWAGLIRRWAQDYGLQRSNRTQSLLAPRGLARVLEELRSVGAECAVTASFAAEKLTTVAPPRLLVVYAKQPAEAVTLLDLRPTESGANVLLLEPWSPVVFERTRQRDGINYVAASQIAVDLLTSPGRGPTEGEELLQWMTNHESEWR